MSRFWWDKNKLRPDRSVVQSGQITKSIQDVFRVPYDYHVFTNYVRVVAPKDKQLEFGLSLVQENIKNSIPVRVFYVEDDFFAFKILSDKYKSDSRLNKDKKIYSFTLPEYIKDRLVSLATLLDCNSGSIDLLLSEKPNEYVFLEINPAGQYGFLSLYTFAHLDNRVVDFLSGDAHTAIHEPV